MCIVGIMTEVSAQTSPAPLPDAATVTMPGGATAPTTAPATPAADNATPNPNNNPGATTETRPGAGGGVDLEKMTLPDDADAYERLIAGMPDSDGDGEMLEPEGGEPPPAPAPAAAVASPAPAPVPATGEGADDGVLPPGALPSSYKVPVKDDPVLFHTLRFVKEAKLAGRALSLGEAEGMAKTLLGVPTTAPAAAPATEPSPGEPAAATPATGLDAQRETAYSAYEAARENFDAKAEADALREINRVERLIGQQEMTAAQQAAQAQVSAMESFNASWSRFEDQAHALFPSARDANSPLTQKAQELQDQYAASQDPALQAIYNSPSSVLFFYTQAAAALGLAPSAAPVPASPTSSSLPKSTPPPVPSHQPRLASALLASTSGTQTPAAPGGFDVNRITTSDQYESLVAMLPAN